MTTGCTFHGACPPAINESREFLESGARVETGQELFRQNMAPVT